MALFGWITASSLVYIYGRDESAVDDFLFVNGREYPRKIVIGDGLSSEIKQTLAGCLSRALPSLIASLRVATPISTLEQAMVRKLSVLRMLFHFETYFRFISFYGPLSGTERDCTYVMSFANI